MPGGGAAKPPGSGGMPGGAPPGEGGMLGTPPGIPSMPGTPPGMPGGGCAWSAGASGSVRSVARAAHRASASSMRASEVKGASGVRAACERRR
eukprot:2431517-Prymnesium_polylepis.1